MTARRIVTSLVLVVIAFAVTVGLAVGDRATAHDRAAAADLSFGRPLDWVHQDFQYFDPPSYPRTYELADPRDLPVTIDAGPLLLTVGGIVLIELVVLAPAYLWLRRGRWRT